MRTLRQIAFHFKEFSTTSYFLQLVAVGTIAACIIQRLGVHAWGTSAYTGFLRSFIIGMWTSCTSAAGILGFERRKGTLIYLLVSRTNPFLALLAVIVPTATFGLFALPLSLVIWSIPGSAALHIPILMCHAWQIVLGGLLLWVSMLSITFVISAIFIITPNATTYEGMILVPALFFSGTFAQPGSTSVLLQIATYFLPTTSAVTFLYDPEPTVTSALRQVSITAILSCIWIMIAYLFGRHAMQLARKDATLEIV